MKEDEFIEIAEKLGYDPEKIKKAEDFLEKVSKEFDLPFNLSKASPEEKFIRRP